MPKVKEGHNPFAAKPFATPQMRPQPTSGLAILMAKLHELLASLNKSLKSIASTAQANFTTAVQTLVANSILTAAQSHQVNNAAKGAFQPQIFNQALQNILTPRPQPSQANRQLQQYDEQFQKQFKHQNDFHREFASKAFRLESNRFLNQAPNHAMDSNLQAGIFGEIYRQSHAGTEQFINIVRDGVNKFGVNNFFKAVDNLQNGITNTVTIQQILSVGTIWATGRRAEQEENQNQNQQQQAQLTTNLGNT